MRNRKLNNQGSTLLTVIIILALVGILGSMMLSATMTNLQMKMLERKTKENFYTCEIVLDEIRAGLYEMTLDETRDIYENNILKDFSKYVTKTDYDINVELKNMVSLALVKELGDIGLYSDAELLAGGDVNPTGNDIFDTYLTPEPEGGNVIRTLTIGKINIISETQVIEGVDKYQVKIVFRDIDVGLTKNDFESRICTDIVVMLPDFSFEDGVQTTVYRMEHPYKDYALIADGEIVSDHKLGDGDDGRNTINGSVYAGGGITVASQNDEYHSVIINGSNTVTRGDITVLNTGSLKINGTTGTDSEGNPIALPAMVWAENLVVDTESIGTSFTKPTTIDIDGICLIKDDLTLNGDYSEVSLKGAYVGYTGTRSSLGSSIIVNGSESSLNLSNLNSLILAGRAHVSVDDNRGGPDNVTDIMTGESVAIKSNQRAYLIPGRFITDIKHNPITKDDINNYGIPGVSFDDLDTTVDINYPEYVDAGHPFKIASKQTVEANEATILYYYYLAFENGKKADHYLREYGNNLLDMMSPFAVNEIILPDITDTSKEVMTVGNLTSYDDTGTPKIGIYQGLSSGYPSDEEANDFIGAWDLDHTVYQSSNLKNYAVSNLNTLYSKISHILSLESNRVYKDDDEVVESTVISSGVDEFLVLGSPIVEYYGSSVEFNENKIDGKIIIVNGNAKINYNFTGLMIVYGDVTIADDVEINGMIVAIDKVPLDGTTSKITVGNNVIVNGKLVAMGDIILGSNNQIESSEEWTRDLFINHNEVLKYIFRNLEQSVLYTRTVPADNLVDLSTMIYYRNWRRE